MTLTDATDVLYVHVTHSASTQMTDGTFPAHFVPEETRGFGKRTPTCTVSTQPT